MPDIVSKSVNLLKYNKPQNLKTAADWIRDLRFSSLVNKSTLGVDTDRVTPDLMLAASNKLLRISRGLIQGDPKDSLQYQRFYGPALYFALHIQKDGGSVARSLLWKATNKGNVDFITPNALQSQISSVFNGSLSQYVDNSTPMDSVDNAMKVTRVGEGGVGSLDQVPVLMRLVQPSYLGYIDPSRTALKSPGVTGYVTKNVMKGTDGKLYRPFYNPKTGKTLLVDSQKAGASVVTTVLYKDSKDPYVYAVGGLRGVRVVPYKDVNYILPYSDEMFSMSANAVPMASGIKGMRLLMGCLHPETSIAYVDEHGYTDIVPAKLIGNSAKTYLMGCDDNGNDELQVLDKVVPRFPDPTRKFRRVILKSGRALVTSPDHKWSIYNDKFQLIKALLLLVGMKVPRSLFLSMPVRLTLIMGITITKLICTLMGCVLRSLLDSGKVYRFSYDKQQLSDIDTALKQLNVIDYNKYLRDGVLYVSVTDDRFLAWLDKLVHLEYTQRRVPKAILSLPLGYTALVLDAYSKDKRNIGLDMLGDIWLLDIPTADMRDGLSFMLNKIYTDTVYHDSYLHGVVNRALQLFPLNNTFGDIVLDEITSIIPLKNPGIMIDLDCDDHVYACGNGVITHNSKYTNQAVSLQLRLASLVQSLDLASGKTMLQIIGKHLGTSWAPKAGMVQAVRKDRVDMLYDDGSKGSIPLYENFPSNAKGYITSYPKVKAGQHVDKDQLIASSNYTDDNGVAALGRNLRVAYLSYKGGTYLDGGTLSLTGAKKMGYTTMYQTGMDLNKTIRNSKSLYQTWKPGTYSQLQMDKLGDDGIVKPGMVLQKGDPMILGIQTTEPSPGTMGKRLLTDVTQVWLHHYPGTVTDIAHTKSGVKVLATVSQPLQVGDKISGYQGNKMTIAHILPDDQMPKNEKGLPMLLLFDPLGVVSRTNPSQMMLAALGKVATKTGKPIIVPQFSPSGTSRLLWTKQMMKQYNVPWKLNLIDPLTGRKISNVFWGVNYYLPLKHIADTKMSARGTSTYTALQVPSGGGLEGSKRLGGLLSAALVGHNAFNFLVTDAKLIRGQSNALFWRSIRTGTIPVIPGLPLVHRKFFNHLIGAGMNIQKNTQGISIMALTNSDIDKLAGNRELKTRDTYLQKNFRPIDGGLFGQDIFGDKGQQWAYIKLDLPLPNPVMLEPLARLLNIPLRDFRAVCLGKLLVNGMKSAKDIKLRLSKINLGKLTFDALQLFKNATKSRKDSALKRYVAIAKIKASGNNPADYMLDKIPVLPPLYRPISTHNGLTMVADSNYLYAQMLDARNDFRDAKDLPYEYQTKARLRLYNSWQLLVGLMDPSDAKLKSKNVGGLLKWALGLGKSPKEAAFARKVYGATVDTVGRGVVVPDSRIKLNLIGMPWDMAWNVYAPFVTRKLVQAKYTPILAMKMVKAHSPVAKDYLVQAMDLRPVVMNRAPSLHKLSLMGFNVKPTTGSAIHVNPSIVVPFGMDFDGDSCKSLISIGLHIPTIAKLQINNIKNQSLTFTNNGLLYIPISKEIDSLQEQLLDNSLMFKDDTKMELLDTVMELQDLPTVEGSEVKKSDTVTEWDVQPGVYSNTVDPVTGEIVSAPVTKVSKHTNLEMFDVTMSTRGAYEHIVTVSKDHSLITYNPATMAYEKTSPAESIGRCVPRTNYNIANYGASNSPYIKWIKFPSDSYPMSYNMGLFFGLMIGAGCITKTSDNNYSAHISCCEASLQQNIAELTKQAYMPFTKESALFRYPADEQRYSKEDKQRLSIYMSTEDKKFIQDLIGHGEENKHIPAQSFIASRAHMLGVLCGLLAAAGSVSYTNSGKRDHKTIAYHTVSPTLRDGIQYLAHRLGIRITVTEYIGTASRNKAYMISFCLEDVAKVYDANPANFVIPTDYKQEALLKIVEAVHKQHKAASTAISYDIVPFPRGLFCEFSWAKIVDMAKNKVINARSCGYIARDVAKRIAAALERRDWTLYSDPNWLKHADRTHHTPEEAKALVDAWIKLVRNDDIGWEVVTSVTPSTCTEGWDCTVPGPYTFALSTGTIVQDTVNLHVPVSKNAIRDVRLKMMPERNLVSLRKRLILYKPEKAYLQGLYIASRIDKDADVKTFNTIQLAKAAYRSGAINIDTPIIIKEQK